MRTVTFGPFALCGGALIGSILVGFVANPEGAKIVHFASLVFAILTIVLGGVTMLRRESKNTT